MVDDALLWLHIAAGTITLAAAPVALAVRKGGTWHRRAGRVFFWTMAVATAAALVLAVLRPNPFLFLIAIFSFYFALSGYRAPRLRRPTDRPRLLDFGAAAVLGAAALAMLGWAALAWGGAIAAGATDGGAVVLVVFGVIGAAFAATDLRRLRRGHTGAGARQAWFFTHLTRMLAATIAVTTAFAVVNLTFLPDVVRWLGPSVVGTAAIAWTVAHYRRRFARGSRVADVADIRGGAGV